ncbi:MAG: hypothetical protein LBM41_06220 [Ruminococcus sp.]|nr:hypothetical protein [Ruminococcus sp.]
MSKSYIDQTKGDKAAFGAILLAGLGYGAKLIASDIAKNKYTHEKGVKNTFDNQSRSQKKHRSGADIKLYNDLSKNVAKYEMKHTKKK